MEFVIKENSWVAMLAAKKLKADSVAIVMGKTIHLHHVSKQDFLRDERWLKHEMCHIEQFKQYGFFSFILKYLWESMKHGYVDNKYEIEARHAEST
ncbi:MAG: DUF4157 domain-containing protein [Ginsengibacter sp.]|jgi:hypothetical protein